MFDNKAFEDFKGDLETYARDFAKAEAGIRKAKEEAIDRIREEGTEGLHVVEILNEMSEEIDDYELNKKINKELFYKTKDKMIAMLENIVLPHSYY